MSFPLAAAPITEVTWSTPDDWERYINHEGKGLYADIVAAVFAAEGIRVKRITTPWKRAQRDVKTGRADFTGGIDPSPDYFQSRFPIIQSGEYVFYDRKTFGPESLRVQISSKRGVWSIGYIDDYPQEIKKLLRGGGVGERDQAMRMVLTGRADYYLDNPYQMQETLDHQPPSYPRFMCRELFNGKVYMSFTPDERGRQIRDIWDRRMQVLLRSGTLQTMYSAWRFRFPEMPFQIPYRKPTETAEKLSCL